MRQAGSEQGFSLVEVIVALGILSTAAIGFSELTRGSIDGAKQIEMRYLARTIAENEMVRTFTDGIPLRIGETSGETIQMGRSFSWVRTITATGEEGLLLVELQVSGQQSETVLVQLSTLKEAG